MIGPRDSKKQGEGVEAWQMEIETHSWVCLKIIAK